MAKPPSSTRFSKEQRSYYIDKLQPYLDMVYRFAFSITLNLGGARKLTEFVYLQLSQELDRLEHSKDPKVALVQEVWEVYHKTKKKTWQAEDFPLSQTLKKIELEPRFCLLASDVFDVSLEDLSQILDQSVEAIRGMLIDARGQLIESSK